jgi:hypothetical protein
MSMAMPDAPAGYGNCCLADQDRAGLRYCPARHLGQPGPGQCLPDRVYLTGARTLPAPAVGALAALGPAGLAELEAEALRGAQPAHMISAPPRLTIPLRGPEALPGTCHPVHPGHSVI